MLKADLHLHSCLSPCADLRMSPRVIVQRARTAGLDLVALTDHNSCRNSAVFAELCALAGLACLHGMEACTAEEVHVLCLFDRLQDALQLEEWVYACLPPVPARFEATSDQVIVNSQDEILGFESRYLGVGSSIGLTELTEWVRTHDGLLIPSHVDRTCYSLMSQLGRIPDLAFDALEISPYYDLAQDPANLAPAYPLVGNSDAHAPERVGRRYTLYPNDGIGQGRCVPFRIVDTARAPAD